ncbi:MAG: hypothetical protein ACKVS9_03370 [Phycisphaerae bacterium]
MGLSITLIFPSPFPIERIADLLRQAGAQRADIRTKLPRGAWSDECVARFSDESWVLVGRVDYAYCELGSEPGAVLDGQSNAACELIYSLVGRQLEWYIVDPRSENIENVANFFRIVCRAQPRAIVLPNSGEVAYPIDTYAKALDGPDVWNIIIHGPAAGRIELPDARADAWDGHELQ